MMCGFVAGICFANIANAEVAVRLGVTVAELCRAHIDRETNLSTLFAENGFEKPANETLARMARLEAYHARLRQAERHPTFRPDPSEFEEDRNSTVRRLQAALASERTDIFVHKDAAELIVNVTHFPKRSCGFIYYGQFVDWAEVLGYTSQNSKQVSNPFVLETPSLVEASNRRAMKPGFGALSIISQTFEPADFGGHHPVTTWVAVK